MFPNTETVTIGDKEIVCMDLTYGYIVNVENGTLPDTLGGAVENGTNLTAEEIEGLRKSEVEKLYHTVMKLTYPHLYEGDGSQKELTPLEQEEVDDKKKA